MRREGDILDGVSFRDVAFDEYDELVSLWMESGLHYRPKGRDSRSEIEKQIEDDHCFILGAYLDEKLIGTIIGSWNTRKGWINRLVVHPIYRRLGLAKTLIEMCERRLKDMGARIICCQIEDWNKPSVELFVEVGYYLHDDIFYLSKREDDDV